ncbi:inosine-uridine preferring nucleoside hydrolase family protein [Klebsormidium nitens]|uniref:Inosine-uridine preferring nucleoside hydrolase family protein n=1 Tax=Klebsormidium nitens TaxID=105231 RepID=A0A1Y1I7B1_KLENI|nr:inosine-uridine preferring nucleoside hydrolase family protein [Klebsormidium nitens]|eukprot:GAQ84607.1 inosine-uridine preferring nucleoside hydrolase family protein [Klebsormidium nitens]
MDGFLAPPRSSQRLRSTAAPNLEELPHPSEFARLPPPPSAERQALLLQLQQAQERLRESTRTAAEGGPARAAAGGGGTARAAATPPRPQEGNAASDPPSGELPRGTRYERLRFLRDGVEETPAAAARGGSPTPNPNPNLNSNPDLEAPPERQEDEGGAAAVDKFLLTEADFERFPAPPPEELLADKEVVDFLLFNNLPEFKELSVAQRKDKRRNIRDKAAIFDVQGGRLIRYRQVKRKLNEEGQQAVVKLLVLSSAQRVQVLKSVHDEGGHPSHFVTRQRIVDRFWWKTQVEDLKNYCRDCEHCKEVAAQREGKDKRLALRTAAEVRIAQPASAIDWLLRGEPVQQKKAVWLDCDPGHDDAMAIILAAFTHSLDLLGISTVASNQSLEKVTENAQRILALIHREDIGVVPGATKPLLRPVRTCPEIHGESGLDGARLPQPTVRPLLGKSVNVMFDAISKRFKNDGSSQKVSLVATGALTNIALLLSVYPEIKEMIEITMMGGCLGIGNTGPVVEFNIQCDPEAASMVFESGVSVTMVPLEVTHTANVSPAVISAIRTTNPTPFRETICHLLEFFKKTYREVFNKEFPPLHDPCAVAYVIEPEMFKVDHLRVDIETRSELSAGQTVVDVWKQSGRPPNVHVARKMDVKAFFNTMLLALDKADARIKAVTDLNWQGNCMSLLG